jgi:hypothetical protein
MLYMYTYINMQKEDSRRPARDATVPTRVNPIRFLWTRGRVSGGPSTVKLNTYQIAVMIISAILLSLFFRYLTGQ